ncbi:hypothetical protein SUGI_0615290 [Cryptomeria japonica]|nr:hypothetical protein SUGI_0615290 [Cryptomeria japonica]
MEVVGDDNAVAVCVERGSKMVLGRRRNTPQSFTDPTVSRYQVTLELQKTSGRVLVEVLGTNPICILHFRAGAKADSSLEFLKKGESSYVEAGDKFSLSVKNPNFFTLKKKLGIEEAVERKQIQGRDFSLNPSDLSWINPFADFGFLVEGSEFEQFGKRCMNDVSQWDWHLGNESEKSTDDENVSEDGKQNGTRRKNKKKKEAKATKGDVDWMGESDEEKEQLNKLKMCKNSTPFKTRSKSSRRDATSNASKHVASKKVQLDDSIDDDDDDTLGGFLLRWKMILEMKVVLDKENLNANMGPISQERYRAC